MTRDLHQGFRDPAHVPADDLLSFLEEADRLPGMRAAQRAMRKTIDPRPGMRVLDAGCGAGLEAARLAEQFPGTHVTGLDRNARLLEIARRRSADVEWVEADLTALELPERSFDGVRTERVLMHIADGALESTLDHLIRILKPGGRLALFELDYGATIFAPGGADQTIANRVADALYASLAQPLAGRKLLGLLRERGMKDLTATPFSFAPTELIWRKIVTDTVSASGTPDRDVADWLDEQEHAIANGEFVATFTGVLTAATRP